VQSGKFQLSPAIFLLKEQRIIFAGQNVLFYRGYECKKRRWLCSPSPAAIQQTHTQGAKLISACAVITLLHHNHYVALETRWNLLAPQYVCMRVRVHPALQKFSGTSRAHTHSASQLPSMQADNKKAALFYIIITSTFKVERIIVKFYERTRRNMKISRRNWQILHNVLHTWL